MDSAQVAQRMRDRQDYWDTYNRFGTRALRVARGVPRFLLHSATEILGESRGTAVFLRIIYFVACIGILASAIWLGLSSLGVSNEDVSGGAMVRQGILLASAIVIGAYKVYSTRSQALNPNTFERRGRLRSVLYAVSKDRPRCWIGHPPDRWLDEVCRCVHLDVQDYLGLHEQEFDVLLTAYSRPATRVRDGGKMRVVAAARGVEEPWARHNCEPAWECFTYEGIRRGRSGVIQDAQSGRVRRHFGNLDPGNYRTLFWIHVEDPGFPNKERCRPYAVLAIVFRRPFALWPSRLADNLEKRLSPYRELIPLFHPRGFDDVETHDE